MILARLRPWWQGRSAAESEPIRLGLRRIYVLPTRSGLAFGACVMLMLLGSVNYGLSLGYLVTFLLAACGIVAIVHTCRNLAGLSIRTSQPSPVFAGESAQWLFEISTHRDRTRPALTLRQEDRRHTFDVAPLARSTPTHAALEQPARQRGWMPVGRLVLETRFPLGLFRAWAVLRPSARVLVYPRPVITPLPAQHATGDGAAMDRRRDEAEDLADLRPYRSGDKPSHLAWKTLARGGDPWTRLWDSPGQATRWLDETLLPPGLELEERISRLAGWVIELVRQNQTFGLRLGRTKIIRPAACGSLPSTRSHDDGRRADADPTLTRS
jgi:uncharacterized protein (DUF58 family)